MRIINLKFQLRHGWSYSVWDITDYFRYLLKKHWGKTVNLSIKIYTNEIENRTTFKIKPEYYLDLLIPKTIKLIESTKSKITKDKKDENTPYLEIREEVLIHCVNNNAVNNSYQQNARVLYTFVPNKLFGQLLVWFVDQNYNPLEIEDKINVTLIIN